MQTGRSGTPFDILSVTMSGKALAFECKHFQKMPTNIRFTHLRQNQQIGLAYFNQYSDGYILFGNVNDIRVVSYERLRVEKSIPVDSCESFIEKLRSDEFE